jgi:tRNA threonylcarbamoyladenosine modification (KEOPS) complex  Pcc1 subunit
MLEHERMDFGEVVDRVAELEYGLHIDDISSDERHTIYVSLQQSHAERLEKAGVFEMERDTGTVSLGPRADDLAEWIAMIDGDDSLGSKLNRALSALC